MNVDAYFKRLEVPKTETLSLQLLNQLIAAHKDKIPFENLDTYLYKRPADLEPDVLFRKMILHKRGGYCFEQNRLFVDFLKKLGYEAYSCVCKLRRFDEAINHHGIIVCLEGERYFCDVGFGGHSPSAAILLREGEVVADGYQCKIYSCLGKNQWWAVELNDSATFYVCLQPWEEIDFVPINFYMTTQPGKFRDQLIVNRTMPNGFYSLHNDEFTECIAGNKTKRVIGKTERIEILREKFNIVLDKKSEQLFKEI